jgi:penicillin-binding protein 1A
MGRSSPLARGFRLLATLLAMMAVASSCRYVADLDRERSGAQPLAQTSKIFDSKGNLITSLHAGEDRELISIRRIPSLVQDAVVAVEDQRFWHHRGIDVKAIMRAAYVNATTGNIQEGASTITQQYVRNVFSGVGNEETIGRKVREAALAWQLEEELSKEQILTRYLNTVYFGQGAYGIQRGAETFFSRPPERLTLSQSALLAGLIAGPVRWDPIRRPDAALDRRNVVLERMYDLGMIDLDEYDRAHSQGLHLRPKLIEERYPAPYFVDYVKHQILTGRRFGQTYSQRYNFLFKGGLNIYTTVDMRMQRAAETAVRGILSQPGDPYGALTAVDPRSGHIKAMVGGRNYWARRRDDRYAKVNLATGGSTGRQAGSSFKPFALVAALENGIPPSKTYPAPSSIVLNEPPCGSEDYPWNVENYEGSSFGGALTVEQGLISSVNVVYAQIIRDVHPDRVIDAARRMGIRSRLRPYCSSVLGTNEVNTLEMASAFGTLATLGRRVPPVAIERIEDSHGQVLYQAEPRSRQVLSPAVAWTASQILRKVILYGTGTAANIGRPAAGKTGTAQQWRDAWFIGFIPQLTAGVWVGWPQGQISMTGTRIGNITGGSFPAQIWHAFMTAATESMRVKEFKEPREDFVTVAIDVALGCIATGATPAERVRYYTFVPGTEPSDVCSYSTFEDVQPEEEFFPPDSVPSVVGLEAAAAMSILQEEGFEVVQRFQDNPDYAEDTVIDQFPEAGAPAEYGDTVTIIVAG